MSIPGAVNPLLLGGSKQYEIERSLRFNSSDSAYLSRTPASAGNRKTWTWAGWVKRCKFGTDTWVLRANSSGSDFLLLGFSSGNQFYLTYTAGVSPAGENYTSAVLRDPSAWYHLVCAFDSTQATAANRIKLYVNGVQQTLAVSNPPTLNADYQVNSTNEHRIGGFSGSYADVYLADIHFIDGQALDPTSFAETNATTGQWVPIEYTGSYGTNGFRLPFSDNSAATATTLGKDTSGNGNNWTPNNLSVTAGAGNDSLVDTPTSYGTDTGAGGEVRGNYCTWNFLRLGSNQTLSNGNLDIKGTGNGITLGTIYVSSGKWYYEAQGGATSIGIATNACPLVYSGINTGIYYHYNTGGTKYDGSTSSSYGASFNASDIIGVAFDLDAGTLTFYKNGVSQGTAFTGISGLFAPAILTNDATARSFNFGQRPFAYTAPSGFKALCDTNLPTPVVAKPNTAFDVKLYTGNGSTQTISGLGFSPDLVWLKTRSVAEQHELYNSISGPNKALFSDFTDAETTVTNGLNTFNSDGFSLGSRIYVNGNGKSYVAWTWDAGSSTVTNTQGSITSQVRANASAGFSIVTFTMGSGSYTVGHGLGVAPSLLITKARSNTSSWWTYHASLGTGSYLALNTTAAAATDYSWGTAPTSTVFTANNNFFSNAYTYVVYCFAPVAGYSSFGSYTGNGSADGPFVYTGFRPRWLLLKNTAQVANWYLVDAARNTYNVVNSLLRPNLSNAELSGVVPVDFLSNGFKIRDNDAGSNASGQTIVYAAFAENPFQYARAR